MEIKIEDYIGTEEIERIVEEEIRDSIRAKLREDNDLIVQNAIYQAVGRHVDAEIASSEELQALLKDKTREVIAGLSNYNVFNKADAWSKRRGEGDSLGQQLLEEEVKNSKELIYSKVTGIVEELGYGSVKELVVSAVQESFWNHEENK